MSYNGGTATATNTQTLSYWPYFATSTYSSDTGTTTTYTPTYVYDVFYTLDGSVGYVMRENKKEQNKEEQPIHLDKLTEEELFEVFKNE